MAMNKMKMPCHQMIAQRQKSAVLETTVERPWEEEQLIPDYESVWH